MAIVLGAELNLRRHSWRNHACIEASQGKSLKYAGGELLLIVEIPLAADHLESTAAPEHRNRV
jgi:hypothetical protein